MSSVPSVVAQPQPVGSARFVIHPGLAPVVLSGLAVGVLQVSLYHLLLPFVGADVYAFLLSTGLFFLGYSLTALIGERLARPLHWIEITSGSFFLLLGAAQLLFVEAIYNFDSGYELRRRAGILVFLLAGLLQGPILAAYPKRVAERFLRVYEIESLSVCLGALLAGFHFYHATPVLGVMNGGAFALAAGLLLCTPRIRSLYGGSVPSAQPQERRLSLPPQIGLFVAGVFTGSIQYALLVTGQLWLNHRWLIPSVVLAACVAAISLASRTSRRLGAGSVIPHLPFFLSPLAGLLLLSLGAFPFRDWGPLADLLPYLRLGAISFCVFLLPSSLFPRIVEDRSQRYGVCLAVNAIGFLAGILATTRIDYPVQQALPLLVEASFIFAIGFWATRLPRRPLLLPAALIVPPVLVLAYSLHPQYGRGALGFPVYVHSWSRGLHTTFISGHSLFDNGSMRLKIPSEFEHLSGRLLDRMSPPGPGLIVGTGTGGSASGLAVSGREVIATEVSRSVESFLWSEYRRRLLPFPADFSFVMKDGLRAYSERESWAAVLVAGVLDGTYYTLAAFYSWPFVKSAAGKLGSDGILGYLIDSRQRAYVPAFIKLLEQEFRYFRYVPFLDSYGVLYCSNSPFRGRPQHTPADPKRLERFYRKILHVSYTPEEIARTSLETLAFDWTREHSIIADPIEEPPGFDPWDFRVFVQARRAPRSSTTPRWWFDLPSRTFSKKTRARSSTHGIFESVYYKDHRRRLLRFQSFRSMYSGLARDAGNLVSPGPSLEEARR